MSEVALETGPVSSRSTVDRLKAWLPEGKALPEAVWESRHRFILLFIFAHAIGLAIFGLIQGWGPFYALGEGALIGALGLVASVKRFNRAFRSGVAAFACATSSAVFTQFMGGYIEGHFHYFVVVALIALYQDWFPFLLAIGFVALDHGLIGTLAPTWVYNHPAAIANPWLWAVIHAALVLGEAMMLVILWKANEESRARTDLVLASAGEGILGMDATGRVSFANPAATRMLGVPAAALVGAPLGQVLGAAGDSGGASASGVLRFASPAGPRGGRGQIVLKRNGADLPIDWTLNPVLERGLTRGSVLTLADASERMRAEEEHTQRIHQLGEIEHLKEMDRFKTMFINTAAHELHTPLTPLRLHVFALKEGHKGVLSAEQRTTVDVLDRNVERLSGLVEDVLNAARLQANKMVLERRAVDLSEVLRASATSYQESAKGAGVRLESQVDPGLSVSGDASRLGQVVDNLLDNAVKFTPRGGSVRVEANRSGGGVVVRVADTGVGLPKGEIGKLFQPFTQAHSPMERTRAGSGLGLFICRGIVELHGGRIDCKSEGPGKGSTFSFYLPTLASSAPVAAPAAALA